MINKQLIKGSMKTVVLHLLSRRAMHGYEVSSELKKLGEGSFSVTEGTLYPLLHALEADKFVVSQMEEGQGKRKRKVYSLTDKGRTVLKEKKSEWGEFKNVMDSLLVGQVQES